MSITDRPYAGTWQMNRTLVRYTPDCLVYVNGYQEIPGCPTCKRNIPLQKYITTLSVDSSTDPIASATVSLQVPKHSLDAFGSDGNWTLQPGLEIIIHLRGYFPQKLQQPVDPDAEADDYNPNDTPVYPYYQVFRGVVTEVSHEYSGGFYSATMSCSDMLHFWQNLYLNTNGSVFGTRPADSGVTPSLVGHNLTGLSPFSIMYTLVRVGFGAAYGVEFRLGLKTNIDDVAGAHLIKHAALWWEKRWSENAGNLRMYGMDGSIFNAFSQAYLGVFQSGQEAASNIVKSIGQKLPKHTKNMDANKSFMDTARKLGYDPMATVAGVGNDLAGQNMIKMQTYALDFGQLANPSFFGSEYMSKLDIANAVKAITGYEFYQDVDGDIVFKPPFYNLDTSDDPVFVVEDRDLISISESSKEPEATMIKGTGLVFQNVKGTGVDDWTGKGATYIDYRLVAQFGWREAGGFESNYLSNPQAIFVSAISRLDLANVGMNTATISVPMRPELRAGYPIYIRHLDCFYYIKSIGHSFTFGGGCTTNITGIARRRKFLPPGNPPGDGRHPTLDDVKLGEPGKYPALPLYVYPKDVGDGNSAPAGPPRIVGFPNVVFAFDSSKLDVGSIPGVPLSNDDLDSLMLTAMASGSFQVATDQIDERGEPKLRVMGSLGGYLVTREELRAAFTEARNNLVDGTAKYKNSTVDQILVASGNLNAIAAKVLSESELGQASAIQNEQVLQERMTLLVNAKALFAPGMAQAGQYRYFSSSHENVEDQGPYNLEYRDTGIWRVATAPDDTTEIPTLVSKHGPKGGIGVQMRPPQRGIAVTMNVPNDKGKGTTVVSKNILTGDIRNVAFAKHSNQLPTSVSVAEEGSDFGQGLGFYPSKLIQAMKGYLYDSTMKTSPSQSIHERFYPSYNKLQGILDTFYTEVVSNFPLVPSQNNRDSTFAATRAGLLDLDRTLANTEAQPIINVPDAYVVAVPGYTNQDARGTYAIAGKLATVNCKFVTALLTVVAAYGKDGSASVAALKAVYNARDAFFRNVGNGDIMGTPLPKTQAVPVTKQKQDKQEFFTPIFPVSDQNGYEIYGGLPYGRGLNLAKHYEITLIEKTPGADQVVGGIPTTLASMEAIERFFAAYQVKGPDIAGALSLLSPEQASAVAAALGVQSGGRNEQVLGVEAAIAKLNQEGVNRIVRAHNLPVSSSSRGMSFSGSANAQNLGNLQIGGESCSCKGADGAFFLQAFAGEFAEVERDQMQTWLEDQAIQTGEAWAASREAIAGTRLDLHNQSVAEAWEKAGDKFDDGVSGSVDKISAEIKRYQKTYNEELKRTEAVRDEALRQIRAASSIVRNS